MCINRTTGTGCSDCGEVRTQEALTRLEVREGSDFPRFREHIRTRLEISEDGCHAASVCWGWVGSRRYFPVAQAQLKGQI